MARLSGSVSDTPVFSTFFQICQHRAVTIAPVAQRRDLAGEIFHARAVRPIFGDVAFVKTREIFLQPLVGGLDEFRKRGAGEIPVFVVDRLDARPIHRQQLAAEEIEPLAQDDELTKHSLERGTIVGAEIGDRLEIGLQGPQQPDNLDVAVTFGFQPAARSHSVQITVDIKLQQVARRVAGTAHPLRFNTLEPGSRSTPSTKVSMKRTGLSMPT